MIINIIIAGLHGIPLLSVSSPSRLPSFFLSSLLPSLPSFLLPALLLQPHKLCHVALVCIFNWSHWRWITHLPLVPVDFQTSAVFLRPDRAFCVPASGSLQELHGGCPHVHPRVSLETDTPWLPTPTTKTLRGTSSYVSPYGCVRISLGWIAMIEMAESWGVGILNLMK